MIYFISYANAPFINSLKRISEEAKIFGFDKVITYTPIDLPDEIRNEPIIKCAKGGGFWIWKPYIIQKTLEQMDENDILFYLDAGCSIKNNPKAKITYQGYLDKLKDTPVLTCLTAKHPRLPGYKRYYNYQWTKMDLFNYLDAHQFKEEVQICGGFCAVRKCKESVEFISKWIEVARVQNYHMILDTPSKTINYPGFVAHKHDQSILSLLIRKAGYIPLEDQILTYDHDPYNYPFWATRLR